MSPAEVPTNVASERITGRQWQSFTAAWLGWAFDGLDGFLYVLVAVPFVKELLGPEATQADVMRKAAIIQGVFLIGWALGGAFFGRIGDRLGRARTLALTIMVYAVFTGMSFFAQAWWHLLIFRFIAALGIGGEWAAGSALVSETWNPKHRAWASATLQSGYMVGMILAALTVQGFAGLDPRYVFLVGVVPAFATFWIRKAVAEPEEWQGAVRAEQPPAIKTLFAPGILRTTLLTLGMTSIALTTVWAFLYYVPQLVRTTDEAKALSAEAQGALVAQITIAFTLWNIAGNFFATYLAKLAGYRAAFVALLAASFACFYFGFGQAHSLDTLRIWINACAFFSLGLFGIFPLYIPPLFPTLLRTTGAGFCYNFGRIIAGLVSIWLGLYVVGQENVKVDPGRAIFLAGFLYLPGLLLALLMPELSITRGKPEYSEA